MILPCDTTTKELSEAYSTEGNVGINYNFHLRNRDLFLVHQSFLELSESLSMSNSVALLFEVISLNFKKSRNLCNPIVSVVADNRINISLFNLSTCIL